MDELSFLSVLEILYRASLESEAWLAFITEFSKIINADSGQYYLFDRLLPGIIFAVASSNYALELQEQQVEYWQAKDEMFKRWLAQGGEWLLNDREFDKHYLKVDPFHNELLFENDIYHITGYRTSGRDPVCPALGFLWSKDRKSIGDVELAWLKRLRPHFENAGRLHREMLLLKLSANMQQQAVDRLDYPILLVYEGGLITFLNQAAERWLAINSALGIKDRRLISPDKAMQANLERLLSNAHRLRVSDACAVPRSCAQGGGGQYPIR